MAEKTEQPTPKRLRDARKKGQVATSKDVVTTALMIALFAYLWMTWDGFIERIVELLVFPPQFYVMPFRDAAAFSFDIVRKLVQAILLPLIAITILVGIAANAAMVGLALSAEAIKPSLDKLNPAKGVKKIFSLKNLLETLLSLVKVAVIAIVLLLVVRSAVGALVRAPACGVTCLESLLGDLLELVALYTAGAYLVLAGADFAWQKFQYTKSLKMTKEEVKQEYKESEGDPQIKSQRRQLAQELAMQDDVGAVRGASVVVTNPTHVAVALRYRSGETPLPMVVAKGQNLHAKRIVELARQFDVPVMENVPLARSLYEATDVDRYIPSDLIEPVAEVLRWVRTLKAGREG
jgi:type III secretion protein U